MKSLLSEEIKEKWNGVICAEGVAPIENATIRNNTIRLLENTQKELAEVTSAADGIGVTAVAGAFSGAGGDDGTATRGLDPVLISMVRRTMPSLIANEIIGVQPMSGPTGLIFAMKANYVSTRAGATAGDEAFGTTAPHSNYSGNAAGDGPNRTTANAEIMGRDETGNAAGTYTQNEVITQTAPWPEMSFEIEKVSVTAQTRALKAKYTQELAQDLRVVHGMDAESELANILSTEVTAEINREIIGTLRSQAIKPNVGTVADNTYTMSTDADGRWEVETYKNLYMEIVRQAGQIALNTRRGVGNFIVVSSNVAAALESATKLDVAPLQGGNFNNDYVGATYAGLLGGRFKMYVDPYAASDFVTIGYKGANVYDAGMFYCPYVPLQMMKAIGEEDFQPRIGLKTRYAVAFNPFVTGTAAENDFYREFQVVLGN